MTDPDPTTNPQDWSDLFADAETSDIARALLQPAEPVPEPDN